MFFQQFTRRCLKKLFVVCLCALLSLSCIDIPVYAGTITTPMVYDEESGYYIQTVTETTTGYDASANSNVTTKRVTTFYYMFENNAYRLMSQTEKSEIISTEPLAAQSPVPSPSFSPYQTATPVPVIIPTPSVTVAPSASPVPFTMSTNEMKLTVSRASDKKAKLTWKEVDDASGYYIYRSLKEKSDFKLVKIVSDPFSTSCTSGGLYRNKVYYYKITAYQNINGIIRETEPNDPVQVSTITVKKITQKLKKLEKSFPDGMYWNHAGYRVSKGQKVYGFVTDIPCNHSKYTNHVAPTCNYYLGTDHVLGYQCSGYASLLSDKIFGKSKSRKHTSYKKSKVGDVVRYGGHSVLITEKHSDYIVVTECNYGNTCVIKWGRKIAKSKLSGAVYRTRY